MSAAVTHVRALVAEWEAAEAAIRQHLDSPRPAAGSMLEAREWADREKRTESLRAKRDFARQILCHQVATALADGTLVERKAKR